ncbi:MAG: LysR family transcriptional regulator [Rubellimicrobium sp.]|nr:LysR family transcriptional regulator [Rubellimicrobium sp.]
MREIEAFRAALQSGSLSAAARLLNTSQPNVTRIIANLERKLGYPLFLRRSRGVTPTAEAEFLHAEVERSFHGLGAISRAAEEIGQFKGAHLAVGGVPAVLLDLVPEAVSTWQQRHGELRITVELRESERILHWIRARRFDLGLVSPILDVRDVTILARRELPYVALARPGADHLGPPEMPLSAAALDSLPLVVPGASYFLALCDDPDLRAVVQRRASVDGFVSETAAHLAMAGAGVAFVDPLTARHFHRHYGATVRAVEAAPAFELALVSPRHPVHARAAIRFGEILRAALEAFDFVPGGTASI